MIYGKGGPYGTKPKRRVIPLTARIQPLIEGYFALHETFRFSPRAIQRMLKRVANRARINPTVSPHVLRHTFAVTAIQKGISLPALQRLLGHDTLLTTEIYLDLSSEHVVEEFPLRAVLHALLCIKEIPQVRIKSLIVVNSCFLLFQPPGLGRRR